MAGRAFPRSAAERGIDVGLTRIIRKINLATGTVAGVFLGISVFFATINAFVRYGLGSSFPWAEEFCTYLVVILVFLVQPWLEAADEQLTIGILGSRLKNEALKKVIFIVRGIITVVIFYYLVQFGIYVAEKAYVNKTVTYVLQFPRYILYAITTGIFGLVIVEWLAVIFLNKGEKISC